MQCPVLKAPCASTSFSSLMPAYNHRSMMQTREPRITIPPFPACQYSGCSGAREALKTLLRFIFLLLYCSAFGSYTFLLKQPYEEVAGGWWELSRIKFSGQQKERLRIVPEKPGEHCYYSTSIPCQHLISNTAVGSGRLYFCRLSYSPVPGVRKSGIPKIVLCWTRTQIKEFWSSMLMVYHLQM